MSSNTRPKVSTEMVERIAAEVETLGASEATLSKLRTIFPGLYITYCLDDDIHSGKPVMQRSGFNLYLVGGGDHCLGLTSVCEAATGIIVAEVVED